MIFVDNSGERFGADVSIADLAAFTFTERRPAGQHRLCAAAAFALVRHAWPFEVESILSENGKGIDVLFRDGSNLQVFAPRVSARKPVAHWRYDRQPVEA